MFLLRLDICFLGACCWHVCCQSAQDSQGGLLSRDLVIVRCNFARLLLNAVKLGACAEAKALILQDAGHDV